MDWGKLLHKIRGAIAIPLFSNLCGRVCKSFGDIGKKFANVLIAAGGQKVFYMIPTIRKVSFFPPKLSTGSKKGYSMSRKVICV